MTTSTTEPLLLSLGDLYKHKRYRLTISPVVAKKNDEWVAASILILKKSFNESILCCEHKRIKIKEVVRIHTQARLFVFYTRTRFIWL